MDWSNETITMENLRKLGGLSLFSHEQLEAIARRLTVKRFKKRQTIFEEGESANLVYLLLSGIVRISLVNQENRQVLVTLLPPGELFGSASFFSEKRHPFRCDALTDCTVGTLKPENIIEVLAGIPFESYRALNEFLMGRIWKMLLHCTRGIGLTLRKRLALELLELAAAFGVENSRGTILTVRPTQDDLANAIGASRQRVSECLADFQGERAIIREPGRLIVVPRRLRRIVERG